MATAKISLNKLTEIIAYLQNYLEPIGLNLDVIEFEGEDFAVISVQDKILGPSEFISTSFGVLASFAQLVKIKENKIYLFEISKLFQRYKDQFTFLIKERYLEEVLDEENNEIYYRLTPLGALAVIPFLEKLLKTK